MKKKELKHPQQRRPKEKVTWASFIKEISKRTGFRTDDILIVWRTGLDIIIETMVAKKSILLPKVGTLYPAIKPSRVVVALSGGKKAPEKMTLPARWMIRFLPGKLVSSELLKLEPTEEEIDNLYKD